MRLTLFSPQVFSCDRDSGMWISVPTPHCCVPIIQQMLPEALHGRFTPPSISPRCSPRKVFHRSRGVSSSVVEKPLSVWLQVTRGGGGVSWALCGPQQRARASPSSRGVPSVTSSSSAPRMPAEAARAARQTAEETTRRFVVRG